MWADLADRYVFLNKTLGIFHLLLGLSCIFARNMTKVSNTFCLRLLEGGEYGGGAVSVEGRLSEPDLVDLLEGEEEEKEEEEEEEKEERRKRGRGRGKEEKRKRKSLNQ